MKAQQRNQRYGANASAPKKEKAPQQPKNENLQPNSSTTDANGPQVNQSKPKKQKQKQTPKGNTNQQSVNQQHFDLVVANSVPEAVLQNNSNSSKNSGDEWVTVSNRKGRKNKKNSIVDVQAENVIEDNENELVAPVTANSIKGVNANTGKGTNKSSKQRKQQQQQQQQNQEQQAASESNEKVKKDTSSKASRNDTGETVNSTGEITSNLAAADGVQVDPAKKLRNLKKRLREIETLKTKDISTLDKDQVEKLKRYKEIKKLVKQLEDTL